MLSSFFTSNFCKANTSFIGVCNLISAILSSIATSSQVSFSSNISSYTQTFHSNTSIIVLSDIVFFVTQKIVHLTAAVLSVVYISNSLPSSSFVALVQSVPDFKASFTRVERLFSFGNDSFERVISHQSSKTETEPSEKYISKSQLSAFIVSHSLYIFQLESLAVNINSSGLYGRLFSELLYTKFGQLYSLIKLYNPYSAV
jgi:hypothetical protein